MLRRDQDGIVCTGIKYMVRMAKKRGDLVDLRGDVPNAGNTPKKVHEFILQTREQQKSRKRKMCDSRPHGTLMKSLLLCLFHVNGDEEEDEYRDSGGGNNDEHLHCASPCQNSHNID